MNWKALYTDGTEVKDGDMTSDTRPVLHDGLDTGQTEAVPAAANNLDMKKLAQFILYSDTGEAIHSASFDPKEKARLLYWKRHRYDANSGTSIGSFYLVGKLYPDGVVYLNRVLQDGTVEYSVDIDTDFSPYSLT